MCGKREEAPERRQEESEERDDGRFPLAAIRGRNCAY